ncbi:hypothetical protein SAMN02910315_02457 [Methanobrevibacter millerae]|uniref:Uncharacterized protein n=1 Tax=Methanobrevibacter millerae TaxID=230361 RepID=A0A1G5XSN8_9EURY|nr:hypothetical protein SAMN02910315_02457 [Methanobrevibacter millerae]
MNIVYNLYYGLKNFTIVCKKIRIYGNLYALLQTVHFIKFGVILLIYWLKIYLLIFKANLFLEAFFLKSIEAKISYNFNIGVLFIIYI